MCPCAGARTSGGRRVRSVADGRGQGRMRFLTFDTHGHALSGGRGNARVGAIARRFALAAAHADILAGILRLPGVKHGPDHLQKRLERAVFREMRVLGAKDIPGMKQVTEIINIIWVSPLHFRVKIQARAIRVVVLVFRSCPTITNH